MEYPSLRMYKAAIADTSNLQIPFFTGDSVKIFLNKRGQPFMSVGGFGAVFRFKDKDQNQYGLKVFTRDAPGRAERYTALHDTLQITKFPFMVDFHYVPDGLKVGSKTFPVVAMQWGAGRALDSAIHRELSQDPSFTKASTLAGNIYSVAKVLQEWNMGHGDFQQGNLLIKNDHTVTLIDYDGMFVPALDGQQAGELGMADYQHPGRAKQHFGSAIDDFSLLSILYQLSIITPDLWKKHNGENRLLMAEADYKEPKKSKLLQLGLKSSEAHVQALAELLSAACESDPLKIGAVASIQSVPEIVNWLTITEQTTPDTNFTSIISKVVSLTPEQVEQMGEPTPGATVAASYGAPSGTTIPAAPQSAAEAAELAQEEAEQAGNWKFFTDLLFEEVDTDHDADEQDPVERPTAERDAEGAFSSLKKGFMNLIFEDVPTGKTKSTGKSRNSIVKAKAGSGAAGGKTKGAPRSAVGKTKTRSAAGKTKTRSAAGKTKSATRSAAGTKKGSAKAKKKATTRSAGKKKGTTKKKKGSAKKAAAKSASQQKKKTTASKKGRRTSAPKPKWMKQRKKK